MEDQLEKEARFRQLIVHSSHDSAIDTDSMEWETEVVELEKQRVREIPNVQSNQHLHFDYFFKQNCSCLALLVRIWICRHLGLTLLKG